MSERGGRDRLTFGALRQANIGRLPHFKNRHGEPAHSEPDGSDWSPAQWLQAVLGELGEYANLRKKYERGDIDDAEFAREAADELADVQCYLDILAFRLGIDLGAATADKWNRISERVGYPGRLRAPVDPPERVSEQGDANEYRPWESMGITELAYWKQRYIEARMEVSEASALREALKKVRTTLDLLRSTTDRYTVGVLTDTCEFIDRALEDTKGEADED